MAALVVGDRLTELPAPVDERASATTCANCATQSFDPLLEGWHAFDDGLGEEHALCRECTAEAGSPRSAAAAG